MLMTSLKASTAIALILAAQFALAQPARASGLSPALAEPEVAAPPAPLAWAAPYIGIQIGCSWLDDDAGFQSENGPCGTVGGVHLGFNLPPRGDFVLGGEVDVNSSDHRFGGPATAGRSVSTEWEASIRLRLGYLISDNAMVYTAGGVAFAGAEMSGGGSNTHMGWTLGVGYERALSEHWLGRVEIRHNEYGSETYQSPSGPVDVGFGNTQALIGLSYKF